MKTQEQQPYVVQIWRDRKHENVCTVPVTVTLYCTERSYSDTLGDLAGWWEGKPLWITHAGEYVNKADAQERARTWAKHYREI